MNNAGGLHMDPRKIEDLSFESRHSLTVACMEIQKILMAHGVNLPDSELAILPIIAHININTIYGMHDLLNDMELKTVLHINNSIYHLLNVNERNTLDTALGKIQNILTPLTANELIALLNVRKNLINYVYKKQSADAVNMHRLQAKKYLDLDVDDSYITSSEEKSSEKRKRKF